jgi:serine/threonine protein kinase
MPTAAIVVSAEPLPSPTAIRPHGSDILSKDLSREPEDLEVLAIGGMGYVYKYKGFAYKQNCFQREYDLMQKAGDCAVKAVARVVNVEDNGRIVMTGLLMEFETPLNIKRVTGDAERAKVKDEMISLVSTLHDKYRMVHGDIKPLNMLRCRDGKLRLCDFDSARPIDEDPQLWEGLCTEQYLAPNRDYFNTGAVPTPSDDLYALGITLWELYTGKDAFIDQLHDIEEILQERRTVDLMEVDDEEVRELIRCYLRQGGALV